VRKNEAVGANVTGNGASGPASPMHNKDGVVGSLAERAKGLGMNFSAV